VVGREGGGQPEMKNENSKHRRERGFGGEKKKGGKKREGGGEGYERTERRGGRERRELRSTGRADRGEIKMEEARGEEKVKGSRWERGNKSRAEPNN